jgi:hypothetical protein
MTRALAVLVTFLLLAFPAQMFAKGETLSIIIKSADLKAPIEITDPHTLAMFNVWTGPGTSWTGISPKDAERFIVDWSQAVTERPRGLQRYEVFFYTKLPNEHVVYVVFYEYDPATQRGYVYLPGRTDDWYGLNVGTIFRGVEGQWFRAWSGWDLLAGPLIANNRGRA